MRLEVVAADGPGSELADQINSLHAEMTSHMTMAVKKAIEIGRLLTEQKAELAHGEWIPWVESNLTFNDRQAWKYMRVYQGRDQVEAYLHSGGDLKGLNQAVALLAEPKETAPSTTSDPEPSPVAETKIVYQTDPKLLEELEAARQEAANAKEYYQQRYSDESLRERQRAKRLQEEVDRKEAELSRLRKLEADKERVETALNELNDLKGRQQAMFADMESTQLIHKVLVRSREFFTRELMQIPALRVTPGAVKAMHNDMMGLIDLVDNWSAAMKEKFTP